MDERIEFRIPEELARRVLGADDGIVLGDSVRKITLDPADERLTTIRDADAAAREHGGALFTYWEAKRSYSRLELEAADLFRLEVTRVFEPAGEECGTEYNEMEACPACGAGAEQVGDLRLDLRRLPRRCDFARSIADELVVSQRLAEILLDGGLSGFELRPVLHKAARELEPTDLRASSAGRRLLDAAASEGIRPESGEFWVWLNRPEQHEAFEAARSESAAKDSKEGGGYPAWHQLKVTALPADVDRRTEFGIDIFDNDVDGRYRCPRGHVAGLNLLSEVFLQRVSWTGSDFGVTRELVGERQGLLRPARILLVTQRVRRLLTEHDAKGYRLEVAHFADG